MNCFLNHSNAHTPCPFFHTAMQLLVSSKYIFIMWRVVMQQLWHSLRLTWCWDDIWLFADAALIIYVDEGGP